MADTNPHNIGTDKVIVSLTALQRYHHQLLEALGLVQDTAAYQYDGTRDDFPEGVTTIAGAIDEIYDLAKSGGVTFNAGKSDKPTKADIKFEHTHADGEADTDKNTYFINAKVGDDIVNIGFDASDFVKDSVLESVFILTVEGSDSDKTYKANGTTVTLSDGKLGTYNVDSTEVAALAAGTYFYYTWITTEGEKSDVYACTCISVKDMYGDLQGDGTYITYDEAEAKIKANTAEVKYVQVPGTPVPVRLGMDGTGFIMNVTIGDGEDEEQIDLGWQLTKDGDEDTYTLATATEELKSILEEKGYVVSNDFAITDPNDSLWNLQIAGTVAEPGDGEWKAQVKDEDGNYTDATDDALATTNNVKEVAQTLQDQIDTLAQGTLTPGEITLSDEIAKSNIDVANNKININIAVASETDINALFQKCASQAESISPISTVNGGTPITAPGEYTINVGEEPEGATTDITWTKQD